MTTGILLGGVSLLAFLPASYVLANPIARTDKLLSEVPEGTVEFVMTGRSLSHILMSYKGYHLNDPRSRRIFNDAYPAWEVIYHGERRDKEFDTRFFILRQTGTYWVGIPLWNSIKQYRFRWNERVMGEDGRPKFWSRPDPKNGDSEYTSIMFVSSFPYEFILEGAETRDGFPVDVWYQVVLRITNPAKAMFKTENWLQLVQGSVDGIVRDYVGHRLFSELNSELKERTDQSEPLADSHEFSRQVCNLNTDLPNDPPGETDRYKRGLIGRFGITLEFLNVQNFAPAGQHAGEYERALAAEFLADKQAAAIRKLGQANADAELAMGTAKATAAARMGNAVAITFKAQIRALTDTGKLGELIVQTNAMKADGAGTKVIWANNPFIRSTGLDEILDKYGIKPDELEKFIQEVVKSRPKGDA